MDDKNEVEKLEEIMLPGFRFHPTDEELVSFYLKSKIQQRPLAIELIKQVDIYKYDPWDLPNLASTGEKEWYFYCPRDRKYRNSARPNRVTGAGFWKATGTDRPIYSSSGNKCIGLKKSLVFYRGRAAKGIKTDWMMHEFRLPSNPNEGPSKKFLDKNLPPNDLWAICRIFKKANTMAQRALSHSWMSSLPETPSSDMFTQGSENVSCTTETNSALQFCNELQPNPTATYSGIDIPSFYKPFSLGEGLHNELTYSSHDMFGMSTKSSSVDVTSMLFSMSPEPDKIDFGGQQQQLENFSMRSLEVAGSAKNHGNNLIPIGFPFTLTSSLTDEWKPNLPWDSPPCPSEMSSTYPTNNCT